MQNILNILTLSVTNLLFVSISSCTSIEPESHEIVFPKVIRLSPIEANTDSFNLSDIAGKVEYIPLQTTDSSFMDYFYDFTITKDFFFIKNKSGILIYDKWGKYIKSLFTIGRGPEEALTSCLTADETNEFVYVLDNSNKNVKIYDFQGKYINTIRKPINSAEHMTWAIGFWDNKLFVSTAQKPNVKYLYSCFDLETDSIHILYKNYRNYDKSQINKNQITPYDYHYQITDSSILFKERFCDTIFEAKRDLIPKPRFIIDLGNKKLKWEDWRDHGMFWNFAGGPPSGYIVQSFIETRSFLFMVLTSFKEPELFAIYNKVTGIVKISTNKYYERLNSQVFLRNDLDNIMPFPPMNQNAYLFYYDGCLYSVIESTDFTEAYQKASEKTKNSTKYLKNMAPAFSKITEFSNPLIMKLYLNDDPSRNIR